MARYATVTYEKAIDCVHIRYLPVVLADEADVAAWAGEIDRGMREMTLPADIIVDLGELSVKPPAARAYDEHRQRMLAAYGKRAFRYSGSSLVRTKILTSSTIHGQHANMYATFAEAVEALRAARASDVPSSRRRR